MHRCVTSNNIFLFEFERFVYYISIILSRTLGVLCGSDAINCISKIWGLSKPFSYLKLTFYLKFNLLVKILLFKILLLLKILYFIYNSCSCLQIVFCILFTNRVLPYLAYWIVCNSFKITRS